MTDRTPKGGRLDGHGLRNEGRYWSGLSYRSDGMAPGICECGTESALLPSANARKRWHRDHKDELRRAAEEQFAARAREESDDFYNSSAYTHVRLSAERKD